MQLNFSTVNCSYERSNRSVSVFRQQCLFHGTVKKGRVHGARIFILICFCRIQCRPIQMPDLLVLFTQLHGRSEHGHDTRHMLRIKLIERRAYTLKRRMRFAKP